jgi:hypothetical protein
MNSTVQVRPEVVELFWRKVRKGDGDGCWLWMPSARRRRYGNMLVSAPGEAKKYKLTHRLAWEMANGTIPAGMFVCHRCDTPACVRIEHLFLGTPQDNADDMVRKGRQAKGDHVPPERRARGDRSGLRLHPERAARGDRNGSKTHPEKVLRGAQIARAKLTDEAVREMRRLAGEGAQTSDLARRFGITPGNARKIVRGDLWRHVA